MLGLTVVDVTHDYSRATVKRGSLRRCSAMCRGGTLRRWATRGFEPPPRRLNRMHDSVGTGSNVHQRSRQPIRPFPPWDLSAVTSFVELATVSIIELTGRLDSIQRLSARRLTVRRSAVANAETVRGGKEQRLRSHWAGLRGVTRGGPCTLRSLRLRFRILCWPEVGQEGR